MFLKICGMKRVEDLRAAEKNGALYAGFIFHPQSPRYISPEDAHALVKALGKSNLRFAGVFVNRKKEEVLSIADYCGLDLVQLHGEESPDYCEDLQFPYWKAFRIKEEADLEKLDQYKAKYFLLDAWSKDAYGGTGKRIRNDLIEKALQKYKNIIIAGGLNPQNLAEVLSLNPAGVDINSGVEDAPAEKNHQKIKQIGRIVKEYKKNQKGKD